MATGYQAMDRKRRIMTRNPLTSEEWALLRASVQQSTADETKKKWGQGRISKPEEDAINRWVAQQLISPDDWARMEQQFPGDLKRMAEALDLPVAAVIWRARSIEHGGEGRPVELTPEAVALLVKPATGSGGIQSLLRSLQANLDDHTVLLQRKQFERLREYLVNLGGGGKARLQAVIDCALAAISRAGGLQAFFGDTAIQPVALKKPAKATTKTRAKDSKATKVTKPSAKPASKARAAAKAPASKKSPTGAPAGTAKASNGAKSSTPAAPPQAPPKRAAEPAAEAPAAIQWKLPVSRMKR